MEHHYKIVVPKKKKNVYETPNNNRICCWWCCHTFDQKPVGLPIKKVEIKERYTLSGIYCSWDCVLAQNSSINSSNNIKMIEIGRYIFQLAKKMHNVVPRRAPPRECLKMFGGPMNIKQFRNTPSNTTYILQTPPILGKFINCCFIIIVLSCHVQSCSVMFSHAQPVIHHTNILCLLFS